MLTVFELVEMQKELFNGFLFIGLIFSINYFIQNLINSKTNENVIENEDDNVDENVIENEDDNVDENVIENEDDNVDENVIENTNYSKDELQEKKEYLMRLNKKLGDIKDMLNDIKNQLNNKRVN
jgi:hypothetical protein